MRHVDRSFALLMMIVRPFSNENATSAVIELLSPSDSLRPHVDGPQRANSGNGFGLTQMSSARGPFSGAAMAAQGNYLSLVFVCRLSNRRSITSPSGVSGDLRNAFSFFVRPLRNACDWASSATSSAMAPCAAMRACRTARRSSWCESCLLRGMFFRLLFWFSPYVFRRSLT